MFPNNAISFQEYYFEAKERFPDMYDWEIHLSYDIYLASFQDIDELNKAYSKLTKNVKYFCEGRLN